MRPPHAAAEKIQVRIIVAGSVASFNEAAARGGGKGNHSTAYHTETMGLQ